MDDKGEDIVRCRDNSLSLSHRKEFFDKRGRFLFNLHERSMGLTKVFYAEDANGTVFLEVRTRWQVGNIKMTATFLNTFNRRRTELTIKGDWLNRDASIILGNVVVAQINRKRRLPEHLFSVEQSYFVTVAPNVDLTLVAAICMCLDEKEKDNKRRINSPIS